MSLLKLAKISGYSSYVPAALKTLDAVLIFQHDNGWFDFSTLPGHGEREPITHTIAYTIEGLFYSGLLTADKRYVSSALKTLLYLVQAWNRDMGLFATYSSDWRPRSKYYCLTGIAQISALLFDAYNLTKRETFLECANGLCRQLKSWHQTSSGFSFSQGGVKGSYPIYGDVLNRKGYCRFAYINWAAKYFADSLFREHTYESS